MLDTIYIVMDKWRVVRMTKNPPSLLRNERVIKIHISVNNEIFKEPTLQGTIEITDNGQDFDLAIEYHKQMIVELQQEKKNEENKEK
jgi:uncharacterized linocin/CFP29 family protein